MKRDEDKGKTRVSIPDDVRETLTEKLKAESEDGRISCARAQGLAKTLGVTYAEVGQMADELGIRIKQCQLGCF